MTPCISYDLVCEIYKIYNIAATVQCSTVVTNRAQPPPLCLPLPIGLICDDPNKTRRLILLTSVGLERSPMHALIVACYYLSKNRLELWCIIRTCSGDYFDYRHANPHSTAWRTEKGIMCHVNIRVWAKFCWLVALTAEKSSTHTHTITVIFAMLLSDIHRLSKVDYTLEDGAPCTDRSWLTFDFVRTTVPSVCQTLLNQL